MVSFNNWTIIVPYLEGEFKNGIWGEIEKKDKDKMCQGKCTVSSKEKYVLVSFSHPTADMKQTQMACGFPLSRCLPLLDLDKMLYLILKKLGFVSKWFNF